jgi:DNA-binding Lrp family transcriptional regulator
MTPSGNVCSGTRYATDVDFDRATAWRPRGALPRASHVPCQSTAILLDCPRGCLGRPPEARMIPFFVQIKCHLGKAYDVANALAESEIASEIYSTAGDFDLLAKFYVDKDTDIGHFVTEKVQTIAGIQDTRTIITFKAF